MATVNHVRVNNYPLGVVTSTGFESFWELTRAIKKAGWKYKASSDGTTKESSGDPAADIWGSGVTSNAGAAAASIASPIRGRATITGLSGIVAGDKGRFLLISGAATGANNNQHQIEEVLSSTSVRIDARNFAVASDANNGSLTWSILDPLLDVYSSFTAALNGNIAWWCAQGPSVLKIPITAAAVGIFEVGENVIQATTGAEGEILGYTHYKDYGWLVIAPRLSGTGTGVHGWETSYTITGGYSGATAIHDGTAVDYSYEVVFTKPAASTTIHIAVVQADTVLENTELFSYCATQAGCTATVQPGGGGTGNAFGTHAWVMWGTSALTGSLVTATTTGTLVLVSGQYVCVDAIPEQNYSADGSWSLFLLTTTGVSTTPVGGILYGFHRMDELEDGELSPYVTMNPGGTLSVSSSDRFNAGTVTTLSGQNDACQLTFHLTTISTTRTVFRGWRARGVLWRPLNLPIELFEHLEVSALQRFYTNVTIQQQVTTPAMRMQSSASPYAKAREPLWLTTFNAYRFTKGTLRWLYWVSGDQVTDVYGTDPAWTQLSSQPNGAMVIGPTDGTQWTLSI